MLLTRTYKNLAYSCDTAEGDWCRFVGKIDISPNLIIEAIPDIAGHEGVWLVQI